MKSEAWVQHEILKTYGSHPRLRIWRNNVVVAWFADGKPARQDDPGAYPVRAGLPGQADLSGLIWPDGRRLEIECKAIKGRQSDEQKAFQRMIERFGGLYILARDVADVDAVLATVGVIR